MKKLTPVAPSEIADALRHALCFHGRRHVHDADELMARIVADRLVEHLLRCGFTLCRSKHTALPTTSWPLPIEAKRKEIVKPDAEDG